MKSLWYIIAVLCVAGWLLGLLVWNAPGMIHILVILAIIAFLFGIIRKA